MERLTFEDRNCSVARSLDVLGDWWNVLIVLECLWGSSKFDEFQRNLGVSKGILSKRLKLLQDHDILIKRMVDGGTEYQLTEKGLSLHVIVVAILQWGDRWNPLPGGAPVIPVNRNSGAPVKPVQLFDTQGEAVDIRNLGLRAGPGANAITSRRLEELVQRRKAGVKGALAG
ncbi:helix-turn-helix transcriptional regulator [Pseudomonas sp. SR9]|uniref:Helix-turn-helix transcriptional regulator n=1 Tax=Aquipseudomonas guryensis TaxID=2759165 RepID=A0A7W4DCE9_9GAMM|nr:helix-turn-helix transcriptional regulator [Pseudomonas guryensis]